MAPRKAPAGETCPEHRFRVFAQQSGATRVDDISRIHELAEHDAMRVMRWERDRGELLVDVTCDVSPSS